MTETVKIELYAKNIEVTKAIATELAYIVSVGTIILLDGNLGSGKTTFMQAFGLALGIKSTITSPTFTLIDEYIDGRLPLYHIDLYRLEPSQVGSLHLDEYWRGEDIPLGVVAIEWANKLLKAPPHHLKIDLSATMRSPLYEPSQNLQNINLDGDEEPLEDIPEDRIIRLTAQGESYIKMLNQFKSSLIAQRTASFRN